MGARAGGGAGGGEASASNGQLGTAAYHSIADRDARQHVDTSDGPHCLVREHPAAAGVGRVAFRYLALRGFESALQVGAGNNL